MIEISTIFRSQLRCFEFFPFNSNTSLTSNDLIPIVENYKISISSILRIKVRESGHHSVAVNSGFFHYLFSSKT